MVEFDGYRKEDEVNTQIKTIIALQVARYVLVKLVDGHSVESLASEFDNDTSFIDGVIEFLVDRKWAEFNHVRGLYQMINLGEMKLNASKVGMSRYN
jgi:hypothetical protein